MAGAESHPITLERVFFTRSIVVAVPEHQPNGGIQPISGPENSIDIAEVEGIPGKYQGVMRCVLNQAGAPTDPYVIDMECVGLFVVDSSLTPERAQRGVLITAHSVLYGAIREAVAWITGRHPYGQLLLGLSILPTAQPPAEEPKEQ